RRDLEDRIAAGVHDQLAGLDVLVAELVEDHGPRGRLVAQDAAAGALLERIEDLAWEAVGEERKRLLHAQPGDLPVPGRGVLARRRLLHLAVSALRRLRWGDAGDRRQVAEPELLQRRQLHAADLLGGVAERVRADVAVLGRVGKLTAADRVHDQEN